MDSPIAYFGGKSRLSSRIIPLIPSDHVCYCEPFCGAAWVLFRKPPSKNEVINDIDGELINFWRIVQNHLNPFLDYFKWAVLSRELFNLENKRDPSTLTDLQRAARYYYLQRLGFGGKVTGRTFGACVVSPPRLDLASLGERLLETHWRLQKVTIERLDFCACILKYDRPTTFFFIDPPYYHLAQDYCVKFEDSDLVRLCDTVAAIKGRFILSINDHPDTHRLFKNFRQIRLATKYSAANNNSAPGCRARERFELLIHNLQRP